MRINAFLLFLTLFLLTMVAWSFYPPLRYLKYFLPLVALALYARPSSAPVERNVINYYNTFILFYLFVIAYLLLLNLLQDNLSSRFLPNAIFILSPLAFMMLILPFFKIQYTRRYILTIFFISIVIFLHEEGQDLLTVISDLQILKGAIVDSNIPTENHLAFAFGFFVLFFITEKYSKWYVILAIIAFILCYKRIVIAAIVLCLGVYFFLKIFRVDVSRYRNLLTIGGVTVNLVFIMVAYFIVYGTFDDLVFQKTGFSTDQFLMGRKTFYTWAFEEVGAVTWTGTGLGKMDDTIFKHYGVMMNLHSEVLKNYFEFGAVLFVVWLVLLIYKNLFSNKAAIFLLYLNVLMLTDNAFIYFDVMFYFYLFILVFLHQRNEQLKS